MQTIEPAGEMRDHNCFIKPHDSRYGGLISPEFVLVPRTIRNQQVMSSNLIGGSKQ